MLIVVHWLHLLAAATWMGGLIVLAATIVALRKAGADRPMLQAVARQFARVSWTAMGIAVATGLARVPMAGRPWIDGTLHLKMTLVFIAIVLAAVHQFTAKRTTPAQRGMIQGLILLVSLAIYGVAVML